MDTELASRLLAAARAGDVAQVRALVPCTGIPEEDGPPDARAGRHHAADGGGGGRA